MASSDQAALPSSGTASMPESLRRLSITNPILFSSTTWAALCVGYGLWQVPEAPLTSPELLSEQLKLRIRSIPVPSSSPRYQQFKEYYTREHDLQLQEYKAAHAKWQQSTAAFNWRAFAQGLGVGVLILCGALAVLEYHYGAISYWMEVAEEIWSDVQQKRQKRLQLADSAKMERLLQEIGEGAEDAGGSKGGPSKRRKPEGESRQRVKSPAAPETKAATVTPSQPVPVSSVPTVPKEDAPKATSTPTGVEATTREAKPTPAVATEQKSDNPTLLQGSSVPSTFGSTGAARLRERLRCKVIERHRQQAEQATTPSSQESSGNGQDPVEPAPKKEKKSKNKKAQAKKEEAVVKKEPEAKPQAKPEETAPPAPAAPPSPAPETPATPAPAPANDGTTVEAPAVEQPSAAEKDAPVKVEQATSKKSKNAKAKKAETRPAENNSRTASKEAAVKPPAARKADPEVEAALQRLARQPLAKPSLRGPELLREAQELLSRLEAEDLLKQLENEEEHARRAAGKKKAKKNKAAARAKASSKKGQKGEAPVEVLKATLPGTEADAEDENVEIEEEEVASEPSEIKLEEADKKESEEESTEMHSSDGHDTHSSSAASDEERCAKNVQAVSIAEERGKKKMDRLQRAEAVREAKVEATTEESSASADASFNGALAGAQILDFLRSGKQDKETRAEPSRKNKNKTRQQKEPEAPVQSEVQAKAKATPKPVEKVQPKVPVKTETKAKAEEKESGSSEDSTEMHSSDGQDSHSSSFSVSDEESGKRVEAAAPVWNDPSFNGALAGAQILDFLRSGPSRQEPDSVWKGKSKSWPCPPESESKEAENEAASSLRAEAPEFVPGQSVESSSEDPQPVMVMPDQLPPGCQIVMVPVQMPMFEAMVMPMPAPSPGCMMMPMNMDMMQMESPADWTPAGEAGATACCPDDVDKAEKEQEPKEEQSGCESDDDCDSIFGEPPALKRQMTI